MRQVTYAIERKPRRVILKVRWNDSEGDGETALVSLRGWRASMVSSAFKECDGSWDSAMRALITMKGLSACRSRWGAEKLIETVKAMELGEVHFWASKIMAGEKKAASALKKLYGVS
jgi:hypothetical protein